jgi:transcriptional regulator with XRE-family HTH domain
MPFPHIENGHTVFVVNHDGKFTPPISASALGARLAKARRARGWSQRQLAIRSGVSSSTVSRLELGLRRSAGIEVVIQLAEGLGCAVEDLIGFETHAGAAQAGDTVGTLLTDLQRAIVSTGIDRQTAEIRSWAQLSADIRRVGELRLECEYRQGAWLAAQCLVPAHNAIHGPDRDEAIPALAHLYFNVAVIARMLGDGSTGWVAADRCLRLGDLAHDAVIRSAAAFAIAYVALGLRVPERALDTITETLIGLQPDSAEHAAAIGTLHLSAALSSMRLTPPDQSGAEKHLMLATDQVARAEGHDDRFGLCFGLAAVQQWQMSSALDAGDVTTAIAVLARINPTQITLVPRACAYHIDLARIYAATGRPDFAVRMLMRAHTIAPQFCAPNPAVLAAISALRGQTLSRTAADQLRLIESRHRS